MFFLFEGKLKMFYRKLFSCSLSEYNLYLTILSYSSPNVLLNFLFNGIFSKILYYKILIPISFIFLKKNCLNTIIVDEIISFSNFSSNLLLTKLVYIC